MSSVPLCGLHADNPMAFLAALGALSLVTAALAPNATTIDWIEYDGNWRPRLDSTELSSEDDVIATLLSAHGKRELRRELGWERDVMKVERSTLRHELRSRLQDPDDGAARMLAACIAELPLRRNQMVSYTPLRLIPRVGRARFLEVALRESSNVDDRSLRKCLFEPWVYERGRHSLRLDPGAPVPARALMAGAPTHAGTSGIAGATMLAVRGLAFYPLLTTQTRGQLHPQAAAAGMPRRNRLVWPIWGRPLTAAAVRMLLSYRWLQGSARELRTTPGDVARRLSAHGIVARYRASVVSRGDDDQALGWGEPLS
jgi:hypothetical protein